MKHCEWMHAIVEGGKWVSIMPEKDAKKAAFFPKQDGGGPEVPAPVPGQPGPVSSKKDEHGFAYVDTSLYEAVRGQLLDHLPLTNDTPVSNVASAWTVAKLSGSNTVDVFASLPVTVPKAPGSLETVSVQKFGRLSVVSAALYSPLADAFVYYRFHNYTNERETTSFDDFPGGSYLVLRCVAADKAEKQDTFSRQDALAAYQAVAASAADKASEKERAVFRNFLKSQTRLVFLPLDNYDNLEGQVLPDDTLEDPAKLAAADVPSLICSLHKIRKSVMKDCVAAVVDTGRSANDFSTKYVDFLQVSRVKLHLELEHEVCKRVVSFTQPATQLPDLDPVDDLLPKHFVRLAEQDMWRKFLGVKAAGTRLGSACVVSPTYYRSIAAAVMAYMEKEMPETHKTFVSRNLSTSPLRKSGRPAGPRCQPLTGSAGQGSGLQTVDDDEDDEGLKDASVAVGEALWGDNGGGSDAGGEAEADGVESVHGSVDE